MSVKDNVPANPVRAITAALLALVLAAPLSAQSSVATTTIVNTVKGYAAHEKEVLLKVTEARSKVAGAGTPSESMQASNQLSSALSRLLVVMERYPDLKANQNFIRLQDELAGTENRLSVARMRYNESVRAYNTTRRRFPTNFVANAFDFEERDYFETPEEEKAVPEVKF